MDLRTAFLSSTLRDLRPHRKAVYHAIEALEGWHCVRMEDFGARDRESEEFCKQQVTRCDAFVGLIGHVYGSGPPDSDLSFTEIEYLTAISHGKPRLMFVIAGDVSVPEAPDESEPRGQRQLDLRRRVLAERAAGIFREPKELARQVTAAIYNFDFRHEPALSRLELASRARRIRRWCTAGLSDEMATMLADDAAVGAPDTWVSAHLGKPLVLLTGDLGSGKSLAMERLLQRSIEAARQQPESAIPVYLTETALREAVGRLLDTVAALAAGLGDPQVKGVQLFLDGVDEVGWDSAGLLLDEARALLQVWPRSQVLVASRPVPGLREGLTVVPVPAMTEEDAWSLVSRVSEDEHARYSLRRLPASVREAIRLPLFAILLAVLLKEQNRKLPRSMGQMLSDLVDLALSRTRTNVSAVSALLTKLAAMVVDREGAVPASDIGTALEVRPLLDSRLVVQEQGRLDFGLPVFREWFAAQSLGTGRPSPQEVIDEGGAADRWRYPLVMMAATAPRQSVSAYLGPLAAADPGLAAEVVRDGTVERSLVSGEPPPMKAEAEAAIREAMGCWVEGLGPLAPLVAPVAPDGTLMDADVSVDGDWVFVGWHRGEDVARGVSASGSGAHDRGRQYWLATGARPVFQPAWAWQWTQSQMAGTLTRLLKERRLPVRTGPMAEEYVWQMVLKLTHRGALHSGPVLLEEVQNQAERLERQMRAHAPAGVPVEMTFGSLGSARPIRYCRPMLDQAVAKSREKGRQELLPPWPEPVDMATYPGQWVWSPYTEAALRARVSAIFGAALQAYEMMVADWFPKLARRLPLYSLMPVNVVGSLKVEQGRPDWEDQPVLTQYMEALPYGSTSTFSFLPSQDLPSGETLFHMLTENRQTFRPGQPLRRMGYSSGMLETFGSFPITELAYQWLWEDLAQVSWVDGTFGRRYD